MTTVEHVQLCIILWPKVNNPRIIWELCKLGIMYENAIFYQAFLNHIECSSFFANLLAAVAERNNQKHIYCGISFQIFLLNFSFWKIMIYIKQISFVFIHLTSTLLHVFSLSQNLIHNKNEIVSRFLWIVFNFCSRLKKAVALDVKRWLLWFGPLQSLLLQIDADRGRRAKNSRYNCYALSVFRYTKIAAICKIYQNRPKK